MTDLETVLAAFREATGCAASVWARDDEGAPVLEAASAPWSGGRSWSPPLAGNAADRIETPDGPALVMPVIGVRKAWMVLGPCGDRSVPPESYLRLMLPVVSQHLQSALEVEHAANELAERYEEINLLYTITEILGRTVSFEEASATILKEISETVGARRGAVLVHDTVTGTLQAAAALGTAREDLLPIDIHDETSVSARVFAEQRARIADDGPGTCEGERPYRRGAMLSVPIMWTAPGGAEPLGVVNLSDRRTGQPFSAGDQKLIVAIATQIGTAIENSRLVRKLLSQQRLVRELELAHDLQMRLLPRTRVVAPEADVAARVVPAESVGGDFYNLIRLGDDCTGVMIGDVSSHGYRAALIMALALSASAIHAQSSRDPGEVLASLLGTLGDELESTEMYISCFYAVIDRGSATLRYANAGHPHAFLVSSEGKVDRLLATDPPLGMVPSSPSTVERSWSRGRDLLFLFTDGASDARDRAGDRLGEGELLDVVVQHRDHEPLWILDRVLDRIHEHTGDALQRDDLGLVIVRS